MQMLSRKRGFWSLKMQQVRYVPIAGSKPWALSCRYSWQSAHHSQKKCVAQSGAGVSSKPQRLLILVRYEHDIMHGIPINALIRPYISPLVAHATREPCNKINQMHIIHATNKYPYETIVPLMNTGHDNSHSLLCFVIYDPE